jgi:tetratricopeptide (TPR) repeat protein
MQRQDRWDVFGARAVLLYQKGRLADAVADLEHAIALAPRQADLYFNRAVALTDLGHGAAAAADLEVYLDLAPSAADRTEALERLAALRVDTDSMPA